MIGANVVADLLHPARHTSQTARYGAIIMEAMARNWTDERLEERFDRVDQRFDGVDRRIDRVDADIRELNTRFDSMEARMDARFDAMHRSMIQIGGGMIATVFVGFLGLIAMHL